MTIAPDLKFCPQPALFAKGLKQLAWQSTLLDDDMKFDDSDPTTFRVTLDGLQLVMSSVDKGYLTGIFTLSQIEDPSVTITFVPEKKRLWIEWPEEHRIAAESLIELAHVVWAEMTQLQPDPKLRAFMLTRPFPNSHIPKAIVWLALEMATKPPRRKEVALVETVSEHGVSFNCAEQVVWPEARTLADKLNPGHAWGKRGPRVGVKALAKFKAGGGKAKGPELVSFADAIQRGKAAADAP